MARLVRLRPPVRVGAVGAVVLLVLVALVAHGVAQESPVTPARANARQFERAVQAAHHVLRAWLKHADATLLLPDRPGRDRSRWIYTPHNSGADLYPYLILTAQLTDPDLYRGRMMQMLRHEVQYTTVQRSIPADLHLATRQVGKASFFGAGEYAKDGLIAVTEYLGRTSWFYRMVDMVEDAMTDAPIASRFGALPAAAAETNGDYLQALVRTAAMSGDQRFLAWARRIGDACIEGVLPGSGGVPGHTWDFQAHTGTRRLGLRDHGNETIVGRALPKYRKHVWEPRADPALPLGSFDGYADTIDEWFTVDENDLHRLRPAAWQGAGRTWLGSELIAGVEMAPGEWIREPAGNPPYAR